MFPCHDLWNMTAADLRDDKENSGRLSACNPPVCGCSAFGKYQPAHFSSGQPWPMRAERICLSAIVSGPHVREYLPFEGFDYLHHSIPYHESCERSVEVMMRACCARSGCL